MNTDLADSCTERSEPGDRTYCTANWLLSAPPVVMASGRTDPAPLVPIGDRVGVHRAARCLPPSESGWERRDRGGERHLFLVRIVALAALLYAVTAKK